MDVTILGLIAATLTTGSFLPQVLKAWKTKETKDLSLPMYLILLTGIVLWTIYGLIKKDQAIIGANATAGILVCSIVYLKLKNG